MPHSCPGVYKRINCIRKVSTRNAHGHHLKWDKKVNMIRAASGSGRPADLPKFLPGFCFTYFLTCVMGDVQVANKTTKCKMTCAHFRTKTRASIPRKTKYVKSGFQVIETQH